MFSITNWLVVGVVLLANISEQLSTKNRDVDVDNYSEGEVRMETNTEVAVSVDTHDRYNDQVEEMRNKEVINELMVFSFITTAMLVLFTPIASILTGILSAGTSLVFYYGTFMVTYHIIYLFYQEIGAAQRRPSMMTALHELKDSLVDQFSLDPIDVMYWISEESLTELTEFGSIALDKFLE
jgi:hypothetical protein